MFSEQSVLEPRHSRSNVGLYDLVTISLSSMYSFITSLISTYSVYRLLFVETDDRNAVNSCVNV
jgi:hypothetical protein